MLVSPSFFWLLVVRGKMFFRFWTGQVYDGQMVFLCFQFTQLGLFTLHFFLIFQFYFKIILTFLNVWAGSQLGRKFPFPCHTQFKKKKPSNSTPFQCTFVISSRALPKFKASLISLSLQKLLLTVKLDPVDGLGH